MEGGMLAGFTSPSRTWFRPVNKRIDQRQNTEINVWLEDLGKTIEDVFAKSNFYNAMSSLYLEAGVLGTGAVLVLPDPETILRFFPLTIGSYYLSCNENGIVDTLYRDLTMSVRQIAKMFGKDAMSEPLQRQLDLNPEELVAITHSIEPREQYNSRYLGQGNMPFVSCWWETNCTGNDRNKVLRLSGFPYFPVLCPRWSTTENDAYGSGLGAIAIGMAKDLQLTTRRKQQNKDQITNPTLAVPTTMRNRNVSQIAGDIVYYDATASNAPTVKPLREVDPRVVQVSLEDITQMREAINSVFYTDLFLMLTLSDRREFTAREIEERHDEKLLALAPVLERYEDEILDVAIKIAFTELANRGRIPAPPQGVRPEDIDIEYISILSQAQRSVGMKGIETVYVTAGNLAKLTGDTSVFDKIDVDQIIDEVAEMSGTAARIMRSDDEVEKLRAEKAQRMQQQQQAALAEQQAKTAKTLSETQTPDGNALALATGAA